MAVSPPGSVDAQINSGFTPCNALGKKMDGLKLPLKYSKSQCPSRDHEQFIPHPAMLHGGAQRRDPRMAPDTCPAAHSAVQHHTASTVRCCTRVGTHAHAG